jgi:MFS-type transporter involved in bile tolerance (Atg22 family)
MQLMLTVIFGFILIGLIARRFEGRQQVVVATFAIMLAFAQFFFPRFL